MAAIRNAKLSNITESNDGNRYSGVLPDAYYSHEDVSGIWRLDEEGKAELLKQIRLLSREMMDCNQRLGRQAIAPKHIITLNRRTIATGERWFASLWSRNNDFIWSRRHSLERAADCGETQE